MRTDWEAEAQRALSRVKTQDAKVGEVAATDGEQATVATPATTSSTLEMVVSPTPPTDDHVRLPHTIA